MSRSSNSGSKPKIMQTIDSFDQLRQNLEKNDAIIQNFIDSQMRKNNKTSTFKILVSIYGLFKSELAAGMQLREVILKQKQDLRSMQSDLSSFCNLFSQYSGQTINSLKDAKDLVFNNRVTELNSMELRETQSELDNERAKTAKLEAENRAIQLKLNRLTKTVKNVEENALNITNKLQSKLKRVMDENNQLKKEKETLMNEHNALLGKLMQMEKNQQNDGIQTNTKEQSVDDNDELSIRRLMIIAIYSVRFRTLYLEQRKSQKMYDDEIKKAQLTLSQLDKW